MVQETILQHWVFTQFILPFLLIWTIVFALLQKTKILGESKQQLDAIVAFVIGLIFVGAVFPKVVVGNLILFLTVSVIVMFVGLLLWGFVSGGDFKANILSHSGVKWVVGIALFLVMIGALFWATGIWDEVLDMLFKQSWSSSLWTNVAFIAVIAAALAVVLKGAKS
ncbi:MAG: hypothetical protein ABFQ65_03185 [Nanoarchaeota archaeon]